VYTELNKSCIEEASFKIKNNAKSKIMISGDSELGLSTSICSCLVGQKTAFT
jgi:hypothetical protein